MSQAPKLVIGNKNYSSWSMRAGLILDHAGIEVTEEIIPLREEDSSARITAFSPSGLVPALLVRDDEGAEQVIWDSLAICEWAAEQAPDKGLLPANPLTRAVCRSVAAEMHSGFRALRSERPMNLRMTLKAVPASPDCLADIARIEAVWEDCRDRFGEGGPFLFGGYTIADALYAPVVSRFVTYGVDLGAVAAAYVNAMQADGAFVRWAEAAKAETWSIPALDRDWNA
ncbi:MAG: glutathione S-transferase family protein [Magnetovibrionaceae bacterium]